MKKIIFAGLILLAGFQGLAQERFDPLGNPIPEELLEQAKEIRSVIIVLKDTPVSQPLADGMSSPEFSIPGMGSLKKVFSTSTDSVVGPLSDGTSVSSAKRNLDNMYTADVLADGDIASVLSQLSRSPLVQYAEPDWPLELYAAPNDEHFDPEQWSLNNTGQTHTTYASTSETGTDDSDIDWLEAWESPDFPTNEIIIAVIDTGVDYTHRDLTNQMWRNPGEMGTDTNGHDKATNGVDDDLNGYVDDYLGIDIVNTDTDPMDDNMHGTHVSGTIAAEANNGYGIAGICPSAKIMAIKIFTDEGRGNTSDGVPAIRYAADHGAKVINNSWGGGGYSQALQDAITYANEKGVSVMCASGNNGRYMAKYPASYRGAISVGATDSSDGRASFSNYGPWVDVMAPGHNILSLLTSLVPNPPYGKFGDDFLIISGTSMATPTAAGSMGLLMSKHPGYEAWIYEKVMEASCDASLYALPANTNMQSGWLGAGRIDVDDMLAYDETNAFLRSYVNLHMGFGRSFLAPGESTNLVVKVGTWAHEVEDVEVFVTSLSSNATLNATNYSIGTLSAQTVTNLPDSTFQVGCTTNAAWNSMMKFRVEIKSGDTVLETRTNGFNVFSGQITDFCTYDLDGDGEKEVIGTHNSVVSVFDHQGKLKWFKDLGQGWSVAGTPAVGDIDGDGKGEIAIVAELINVIYSLQIELTVFEHDGSINTNFWPVNLQEKDEEYYLGSWGYFSTHAAALMDVDNDDDLDIVIAANHNVRGRYGIFDEEGTELGYQIASDTNRYTSELSVGDINADGTNEFVTIESGEHEGVECSWFVVRDSLGVQQFEVEITGGTNVEFGGLGYSPVTADIDFDGEKEFLAVGRLDGIGHLVAMKQDGTMIDGFPVQVNNSAVSAVPLVADVEGDGDLEIFVHRPDLHQILGFDHHGNRLNAFPITDSRIPDAGDYSNGYRPVIGDVDGDGEPELVYAGAFVMDVDAPDDPYSFQLIARDLKDGLMVPGFPITLEGFEGDMFPKYRLILDTLTTDSFGTNQYITASIGSELFVINTGMPFDPNQQHWPHINHDEVHRRITTPPPACTPSA